MSQSQQQPRQSSRFSKSTCDILIGESNQGVFMALTPIPLTTDGTGPAGSIPVSISGPAGEVESVNGQTGKVVLDAGDVGALPDNYVPPVDPVVQALITAGFGTAGQVLATNATADGFEWITPTP